VLDTALEIAVERGVAGVTVSGVAERMSVTTPVVYACFGSREELLLALLEREERRLLEGVLAALPPEPSLDDPQRLLVEGFQALLATVAEHPGSWRIVFAAAPDPAVAERFGRARALVAGRVAQLMEPMLVAAGTEDIERKLPVLVELFMGAGESAVRALVEEGQAWTPEELGEFVGLLVLRALRAA
jgi:AcrR family transcriptional regulator